MNIIQSALIFQYMGWRDGFEGNLSNNMRLIRKREPGQPFHYFVWDIEYTFVDVNAYLNVEFAPIPDTMTMVYDAMRANPEFRLRYADLVHKYLFNDGALTPQQAAERYQLRATEIEDAIIGESARWGDVRTNIISRP